MIEHELQVGPVGTGKTADLTYKGRVIGSVRLPLYDGARLLLDMGLAKRSDTVSTYRGKTKCLTAQVGWAADHTVQELNKTGLRRVKYQEFTGVKA